jgi:hypothetical protein
MHTPEEAVAELKHCKELGLKVIFFPEGVLRPMDEPAGPGSSPWLFPGQTHWFDSFGLDSIYDYDPVWRACQDLGFVAAFHGGMTVRPGLHWSITSYVANHVGQFAASMYPLVKSLLFGGVTNRFPDLPFVFLECGVSWAAQMINDTIEHWEKRNIVALEKLNPSTLDRDALAGYFAKYGGRISELIDIDPYDYVQKLPVHGSTPEEHDEFVHMGVGNRRDIVDRFSKMYFGCEADDRGITAAYAPSNIEGAQLRPLFSSDIGHWDVPDMSDVVAESYELVDDGHLSATQWKSIVCDNPIELYRSVNPRFFDGTALESYAAAAAR